MSDKNNSTHDNRIQVEHVPTTGPKPDPRNTRTHSQQQIRQVADSIEQFGNVNPSLIDEADRIIAGHARLEAAKQLGLKTVPVIRLSHLTEHQKRALAIADDRLRTEGIIVPTSSSYIVRVVLEERKAERPV